MRIVTVLRIVFGIEIKIILLCSQLELFNSIRPLFANKPVIMCVNKVDVRRISELTADQQVRDLSDF